MTASRSRKIPALKRAVKDARRNMVPDNYIKRVIQFARQGYHRIAFDTYDTDWDGEAYRTVVRAKLQQFRACNR